jgi:hypothetical protein
MSNLKCQNSQSNSLITKRPNNSELKCDFQGMINKDNQEFELVITNLTDLGYINFNILKKNIVIDTIDPGGLNEINELKPYESYAIKWDQENNGTLLLNSIKKDVKNKEGENVKLTVNEDETSDEPIGTYYHLSVVPQIDKEQLINLFQGGTVWACIDAFCIKQKILQPMGWSGPELFQSVGPKDWNSSGPGEPIDSSQKQKDSFAPTGWCGTIAPTNTSHKSKEPMALKNTNLNNIIKPIGINESTIINATHDIKSKEPENQIDDWVKIEKIDYKHTVTTDTPSLFTHTTHEKLSIKDHKYVTSLWLKLDDTTQNQSSFDTNSSPPDPTLRNTTEKLFSKFTVDKLKNNTKIYHDNIIKGSYDTSVSIGKKMNVFSTHTGLEYNYNTPAEPCTLCLSISEKIEFFDTLPTDELCVIADNLLDDAINCANNELLDKLTKVWKSAECIICMNKSTDENLVDCVFYQCGHQCCHYECSDFLQKCPMCRSHISAKININYVDDIKLNRCIGIDTGTETDNKKKLNNFDIDKYMIENLVISC